MQRNDKENNQFSKEKVKLQEAIELLEIAKKKSSYWISTGLYVGLSTIIGYSSGVINVINEKFYSLVNKDASIWSALNGSEGKYDGQLTNDLINRILSICEFPNHDKIGWAVPTENNILSFSPEGMSQICKNVSEYDYTVNLLAISIACSITILGGYAIKSYLSNHANKKKTTLENYLTDIEIEKLASLIPNMGVEGTKDIDVLLFELRSKLKELQQQETPVIQKITDTVHSFMKHRVPKTLLPIANDNQYSQVENREIGVKTN